MTLSSSGAQAGEMPKDGELLKAANRWGSQGEVRTLIAAGVNVDEKDSVSDGSGTSGAAFFFGGVCCLNVVKWFGVLSA